MALKISPKVKAVISTVAPTLGLALGGPLGALAGNLITAAVGGGDEKAVQDALLAQKPETIAALRKAEMDFQAKMRELDISEAELDVRDRTSARELAKKDLRPHIVIATAFLGGYFITMLVMLADIVDVDSQVIPLVAALFGVLTAGVPQILNFWFGSSMGSKQKSDAMIQALEKRDG